MQKSMLSSFLSFYIASTIQPTILSDINPDTKTPSEQELSVRLESSSIINIQSIPVKDPHYISPIIEAKGSIAMDFETESILYEKDAHQRRPIASITKLMTTLIILEENDLTDVVTVSYNAASTEGSTMHLVNGEKITVSNLLYGTLVQSANDAAVALAEHNAGTVEDFVNKMNEKSLKLGLLNTKFANPTGLDNINNYSSAYDVAKIAKYVYQKPFVQNAAKTKEITVQSTSGNYQHNLTSTNKLLNSYLNIKGLKTGKTDSAGLCLVAIAENETNHDIITVVLNSPDRFEESKILIDWIFRAYQWQ